MAGRDVIDFESACSSMLHCSSVKMKSTVHFREAVHTTWQVRETFSMIALLSETPENIFAPYNGFSIFYGEKRKYPLLLPWQICMVKCEY